MRKLLLLISSIAIALFLNTNSTFACSCIMPESPDKELEKSSSVFIGKVIAIKESSIIDELIGARQENEVEIEVYDTIKGKFNKTVKVKTSSSGAACGYHFKKNKEYIVYAGEYNGSLNVSLCSRTKLLENADEDIKAFENEIFSFESENKEINTTFKDILIILILITTIIVFVLLTANKRTKKD